MVYSQKNVPLWNRVLLLHEKIGKQVFGSSFYRKQTPDHLLGMEEDDPYCDDAGNYLY